VQARKLRDAAARTFYLGVAAAGMLLVIAAALVRSILRAAARERQLAHERRLASLGEMSAVLAHEIRNPLASLKGNAQLLAERLPPGEKARQKADRVVEEAIRLETLTNNLLVFVRTGELARRPTAPAELLREAAAAVDPEIEVDAADAPPSWSLDAERLRQVLVNLLENAVQAGPPVRARVSSSGGRLVFEVEDHGPGVAAADAERIFEPFFTKRAQGTGLGLAVAKRVVELHAGTIAVEDAPGGGARFRVTIPEA
jgi:two-component system, NtrC family, sensor histidine kinase HydH